MATRLTRPSALDDAQYQAMTQQYLEDIQRINGQMTHDQEEIDRLKAHTRANLTEIRALAAETQALLEKLKAA